MPKGKQFFQSRECGGYAVWSLHNPADPQYGQWSWAEVSGSKVEFIRSLTEAEILYIRRRFLVWGEKISGSPWALVCGRRGAMNLAVASTTHDPTGGVGV